MQATSAADEGLALDVPEQQELTQASQLPNGSTGAWSDCTLGLSTLAQILGSLSIQEQDNTVHDVGDACTGLLKVPGIPGRLGLSGPVGMHMCVYTSADEHALHAVRCKRCDHCRQLLCQQSIAAAWAHFVSARTHGCSASSALQMHTASTLLTPLATQGDSKLCLLSSIAVLSRGQPPCIWQACAIRFWGLGNKQHLLDHKALPLPCRPCCRRLLCSPAGSAGSQPRPCASACCPDSKAPHCAPGGLKFESSWGFWGCQVCICCPEAS